MSVSEKVREVLKLDEAMRELARELVNEQSLLVFGRGYNYATALEAALKVRSPPVSFPSFVFVMFLFCWKSEFPSRMEVSGKWTKSCRHFVAAIKAVSGVTCVSGAMSKHPHFFSHPCSDTHGSVFFTFLKFSTYTVPPLQ